MRDDAFRGPAAVTCVYFMLYLGFMILQLKTRGAAVDRARAQGTEVPAGKSFADSVANDPGARMGERTFLNTLEQMGVFLGALWMCAIFVSPPLATWLGGAAVLARSTFPVLWSMGEGGAWNIRVELSTQPYYCCVLGMLGAVATWAFTGVNIAEALPSTPLLGAAVVAFYVVSFVLAFGVGMMLHGSTRSAYESERL